MWLEEAAVQEGDFPEPGGSSAPAGPRLVQGAEEQGTQKIPLNVAAPAKTPVDLLDQKSVSAAKPALGLDEIQEEDPSELQECQSVAIRCAHRSRESSSHSIESAAEYPKETTAHRLTG